MRIKLKRFSLFLIVLWIGLPIPPASASSASSPGIGETRADYDDLFRQARELAFIGKKQNARNICRNILAKKPDYHEVRVFLGRMYTWDKDFKAARRELRTVIQSRQDYIEPRLVLIDVEYLSGNADEALRLCEEARRINPRNTDILMRKARILTKMDEFKRAAYTLRLVQKIEPRHPGAAELMDRIQHTTERYIISTKYRQDQFDRGDRTFGPWHLGALELLSKFTFGTICARLNYAHSSFVSDTESGFQAEVDVYPQLSQDMYACFNIGYSPDTVFPEYRLGGELYRKLSSDFELSGGVSYFNFSRADVFIYTGSLGKSFGDYWLSFRPYLTSKPSDLAFSAALFFRNHFFDPANYIGLLLGYGSAPVDAVFLEEIERRNAFQAGLEIQRKIGRIILVKVRFRYEREEFRKDSYGDRFLFELNVGKLIFRKY